MGYALEAIPYIGLAEKLGVGSANLRNAKVRKLNSGSAQSNADNSTARNTDKNAVSAPVAGDKVRKLAPYIAEDKACSSCYASLIFALSGMNQSQLNQFKDKICIGQGFKGKKGNLGIGECCSGFKRFCPGCPPSGDEVLEFLKG
jgi:hypothetical protein